MRKWQCVVCGFIYDEALGLPEEGIALARPGKIFPPIGCAPIAASASWISR